MRLSALGLLLTLAILVAPLAAEAQQETKVYRIGLLSPFTPADAARWHETFRQGLRDLGWIEGKNISIESRYAEGSNDRLPDLAADLVRLKVDLIVTSVNIDALAAKNATSTIPIVMAAGGDPVADGFAKSLARPGGNITGLSQMALELVGKRLELLKEIVPSFSRVAVLWHPANVVSTSGWNEIQLLAPKFGAQLHSLDVQSVNDFDKAFEDATRAGAEAVFVTPALLFVTNLKRIADLAAQHRLPSIFHLREFADAGGLMAYGVDRADLFRRAATYVDKILKGAKPADLPVEQPTKFELVINLKTAKALGLTLPPTLLMLADEVIR